MSVVTLLAFNKVNISSIQISTLNNFCLPHFLSLLKPKGDCNIKIFIENELPVKSSQIYGLFKCLPQKIGGLVLLLRYAMLDSSDIMITRSTNLE